MTLSPLHRLIEREAARHPGRLAVLAGGAGTSYGQLARRGGQVAGRLRAAGVGRGAVVGVCLPRSVDLVAALLGVWWAGATYLPLDPGLPGPRLSWMIADSGAVAVLGHRRPDVPEGPVRWLVPPDTDQDAPPPAVADSSLGDGAYVIYTSGSTGQPKGALISHGAIANRVLWTLREPGLTAADRVLQKTSIGFDAAGWELFAPLACGGTVVMAAAGAERDPALIVREIRRHQVTVLQVVPSVLRLLVEEPGLDGCESLRLLFSAGEPLDAGLCQRLLSRLDVRIWNTYGPTECAIDVTAQRFDPAQDSGQVPIGRPLDNVRAVVLDQGDGLVPVGLAGELCAGGACVGLGYVGNPRLTAERFVPDPFGSAGGRMYRTGDLARWRPDGALEFLGRLDDQVKVNGARIEPAEVEAVLAAHPGVRAAVVLTRAGADGQARLESFVVPRGPGAVRGLRAHCLARLPQYMVPSAFHELAELPLTASGKVDRRSLATLPFAGGSGPARSVPPRTPAERAIAQAWTEVLGVGAVGLDDDFFALGGHSLLLARLAQRLLAATGAEIGVAELFTTATVRSQAGLLSQDRITGEPVTRVPRGEPMPMSSGQQRLWFLERLSPGSPEYVVPLLLRLPAGITPETVRGALAGLAAAHETLRTRYVAADGAPRQVIDPPGEAELLVADIDSERLGKTLGEAIERGFDLERGPVWRAVLARVPSGEQVLLLTVHHIACDGRSMSVLAAELEQACLGGPPPAAGDIDYADYAAWQRDRLTPDLLDEQLTYWRGTLAGLEVLELPADHPRPARRDPRGAIVPVDLPPDLARRLLAAGREIGATPFVTLLTVFAATLARHCGQWDVPVGVPVSGRTRPEVQDTVGFFVNSVVLRCGLSPGLTFRQAAGRLRETSGAAFARQDLPFEYLLDALNVRRDPSRTPLFQVMFGFLDEGENGTALSADDLTALEEAWRIAKTDLTLLIQHGTDGTVGGVLEYASALFSEDTIRAMAGRFVRLAEAFAADPDARLDSADMLLPGERRWLLNSGIRQRSLDLPPGSDTIPGLFAAQAARTPDAVAVKSSAGSVSYRELATRAERLARQLAAAGVTHESPVAIRMERSAELVVALLAVLIAGGAYLPVDGRYPEGVVRQMLADANARVLITDRATPASASDIATLRMEAGGASGPGIDPVRPRHPDQLAFIMYTSGSTGAAKGVGVTHRDVIAFTAAGDWRNGAHQRVLMHSATGFDASTAELWVPLLTGGTVIAAPAGKLGVRALADTIEAEGVTAIVLTAALFRLLADEQVRCLAGVREVWAGGDVVPAETVRLVLREFPAITVVNGYGPTETTTFATVHPMSSPASVPDELPIGRPIACTRAYLLDDALSQVPPGVQGELCLGGPQVARGYLGLPGLTAAAFVPDPFGPPGSRMYRTGDLARWRPDGTLAFLGRMDAQVKIRGFRIEPAGVEAVLTRHPSVRSAAVIASQERPRQPGGPADKRLVAYVVPEGQVDVAELRAHVALLLPDYMHPAAYVCLDALPLNAHGKLDRAALPAADLAAPANEAYTAPRTPVERQIAWIWERTTGVEAGIHHDFFEIGGNSLLSARVIAAVEREFGVNVDLQAIFDHPTIAGLALVVEDAVRADIGQLTEAELLAYHARISGNSSGGGE